MGRLRTRNLRAKAKHYAEARARSDKRWKPLITGLERFGAKLKEMAHLLRPHADLIKSIPSGGSIPLRFPKLPPRPFQPPGEYRPFFRPALDEEMVNVGEEINREIAAALARGQTVNLTLDGKVISTYRPRA